MDVVPDLRLRIENLRAVLDRRDLDAILHAVAPGVRWADGWEGGVLNAREDAQHLHRVDGALAQEARISLAGTPPAP